MSSLHNDMLAALHCMVTERDTMTAEEYEHHAGFLQVCIVALEGLSDAVLKAYTDAPLTTKKLIDADDFLAKAFAANHSVNCDCSAAMENREIILDGAVEEIKRREKSAPSFIRELAEQLGEATGLNVMVLSDPYQVADMLNKITAEESESGPIADSGYKKPRILS